MAENSNQGESTVLPRCFLDITIEGQMAGRIVFELFSNVCPKTCENFRVLCTGEKSTSQHPLHYKGSPFHRIVKNFMIQGGDFINGNGTGGESIYGHIFADENFTLKHDRDFLLSMANKGSNSNGSQFFILTKPAPHLDGIHVVFGRVVNSEGKRIVKMIEAEKVDENYRPFRNVTVVNCGELVLLKKTKSDKRKKQESEASKSAVTTSSSSGKSSSESESEREEKRQKKEKKHKKKSKKGKKQKSGDEESTKADEEEYVCTIRADEIPPVPSHKFLSRCSSDRAVETAISAQSTSGPPPLPPTRRIVESDARIVKGRGSFRYNPDRSPSPEDYHDHRSSGRTEYGRMRSDASWRRDGDEEPAHWRAAQERSIPLQVYERRMKGRQEREMIQAERERILAEQRRREEQQHLQRQLEEMERERLRHERERQRQRRKSSTDESESDESEKRHRSRSSSSDERDKRRRRRGKDRDDEKRGSESASHSKGAVAYSDSDESDESKSGHSDHERRRDSSSRRKSPSSSPTKSSKSEDNHRSRSRSRTRSSSEERGKRRRSRTDSSTRKRRSSSRRSSSSSSEKSSRSRSRDRSWRR